MHLLGEIIRLQVQTVGLKVGAAPHRRYDPAGIVAVPELVVDPGGTMGVSAAGEHLGDVHHEGHVQTKSRGTNGVSVLFTGHYAAMRGRFGAQIVDGIAGESILVAYERLLDLGTVAGGLRIVTTGGEMIDLGRVIVAEPCVEFGRFALRYPDDLPPDRTVTDAVRFLSDGIRGFYASYDGLPVSIRLRDAVHAI